MIGMPISTVLVNMAEKPEATPSPGRLPEEPDGDQRCAEAKTLTAPT